jgi:hypothetical protein
MNAQNADSWETPRYNRRPHAPPHDRREDPPAPRRPKRSEEFPALVKGFKPSAAVNLESKFNDLAREMEEERIRQEEADAAAARQQRKAVHLPFPWDMRSGPPRRFQRCDGVTVQAAPMEYREADWDPLSEDSSENEHEQNTDLADKQDRH